MRNANDFLDSRRRTQSEKFFPLPVAISHHSNHGTLLAMDQVRFETALLDSIDDMVDLLFSCVTQHVENHFQVLADG
jgi:hypothetical protein